MAPPVDAFLPTESRPLFNDFSLLSARPLMPELTASVISVCNIDCDISCFWPDVDTKSDGFVDVHRPFHGLDDLAVLLLGADFQLLCLVGVGAEQVVSTLPEGNLPRIGTRALPAMSRPSPASADSSMHSSSCSERFSSSTQRMRSSGDCLSSMMKSALSTMFCAASLLSIATAFWVMPVSSRPNLRPSLEKRRSS